jgi:iron complex transport system ATP-binding protein
MLAINDLVLSRGERCLVDGLDFALEAGRIAVVLGPNGAGKSTLLLALAGMFDTQGGVVRIDGQALTECSHRRLAERVAWQGELPPAEFGLTVGQRLALAADEAEDERIEAALAFTELTRLVGRSLGALSSGERQRVEIAALMLRNCPLWLMDEPTAHLDMRHQVDCLRLMRREADSGRTIVTVLHDLQQAAAVADDVILLAGQGRVAAGPAEVLLTAERLQPLFGVSLKGAGRTLAPVYAEHMRGDIDEES